MSTALAQRPTIFAELSMASWAFATRIWLAAVLALYVSFWLELDTPSSAAVTVAILALPTRGQALEKAGFRLLATSIGIAASITIVGFFAQSDIIILCVFAAWIGLCVYAVGLFDGNRAYAASLGVTTVAIVAVQQIDAPQQVFEVGIARGSAIAVGILAITFVNDTLAAPDRYPTVAAQLQLLHRRVLDYARNAIRGQAMPTATAAVLLRDITALRPDIASLATESNSGHARCSAARSAMVGLIAALSAARALERLPSGAIPSIHNEAEAEFSEGQGIMSDTSFGSPANNGRDGRSGLIGPCHKWLMDDLIKRDGDVRQSLESLQAGSYPPQTWRAPLFCSHRIAAESGIRAALYFALASIFFAIAGWPTSTACLSFVAILIGLSATAPDVSAFTKLAVVAAPIACLLAGILEFVVLNGVTGFPLLAIGSAPFIIGCALMMTLTSPLLAGLGRLNLVFIIALFAPSNPQSYDPQVFLFSCLFACLATSLLLAMQYLMPPMSSDRQITQLLAEMRNDLVKHPQKRTSHYTFEERLFRDAMRVGKVTALSRNTPENQRALSDAMICFDRTAALRLCDRELERLAGGPVGKMANATRRLLTQRNATLMLHSAIALRDAADEHDPATAAFSALVSAAAAFATKSPVAAPCDVREP